jgi:sphingomyelin phosphodiesterase
VGLTNSGTATALNKVMLLSLNTMVCYTFNLPLLREKGDVAWHLGWLEDRLRYAKSLDMQVIIMGHVPPGSQDCNKQWTDRYNILIERY